MSDPRTPSVADYSAVVATGLTAVGLFVFADFLVALGACSIVVGATFLIFWWRDSPRPRRLERLQIVAVALVAIGIVGLGIVGITRDGSGSAADTSAEIMSTPRPPDETHPLPANRAFQGIARDGAVGLLQAVPGAPVVHRYDAETTINFSGYCLGEPTPVAANMLDFRWFIVAGSLTVVPGPAVDGAPPPDSRAQPCPGSIGSPGRVELGIGREYDYLDGTRPSPDLESQTSFVLGASGSRVDQQLGFAAEANDGSGEWVSLGVVRGAPGFTLFLPDGVRKPGISEEQPVRIVAAWCYAPGYPASTAASAVLELTGAVPELLSVEQLGRGSAFEARVAACTPVAL
jgi:hypothetical protein